MKLETRECLTQQRLKEVIEYSPATGLFIWIKKTHPMTNNIKVGTHAGNVRKDSYHVIKIDNVLYKAHRLAWLYVHGYFPSGDQPFIDHINGNFSDNRITNLRISSHAENQRNTKKRVDNSTGYKGVSPYGNLGKFLANVHNPSSKKREVYYGFLTKEEARDFQIAKSQEYYGEFHPYELQNL